MLTAVTALAVRARSARYHALGAPPQVMNGCSDVMVLAFGERGRHARTAVGVQSLPRGVAVEVAPARPRSLAPPRSALPGERKTFRAGPLARSYTARFSRPLHRLPITPRLSPREQVDAVVRIRPRAAL